MTALHPRKSSWLFYLLTLLPLSALTQTNAINMALFPYAPPIHLIKAHKPLQKHFAQALQTQVHLISARDFASFSNAIRSGRYDIILGAPHMGRLAELTGEYEWLGFTSNHSYAVIVTNRKHQGKQLQDFKGQQIILPPRGAIVNYLSRQALQNAGLRPGIDIEVIETSSHQSAMLATINNVYPLAGFGKPTWEDFNPPNKTNLITLFQSVSIPGFALMAHKRLGADKIAQLRKAFLTFGDSTEGQNYFSKQGLHNSRRESAKDMPQLDAFLLELGMLNDKQTEILEQRKK